MISPYGFMYCFEKKTRGDFPIVRVVRYTVNDHKMTSTIAATAKCRSAADLGTEADATFNGIVLFRCPSFSQKKLELNTKSPFWH
jgi:hypothetical protein